MRHIVVSEYDSKWKDLFEIEAALIRNILKENCIEIYHIGSTSVPMLKAKPVIDIMPVVMSLADVDNKAAEFEKIGYEYLGEFGITGRRFLQKGGEKRTHHIHIFNVNDKDNIERHLAMRDYLRTHKNAADEYGELKTKLSLLHPYDIEGYCSGKSEFIKQLEQTAVLWYRKNNL